MSILSSPELFINVKRIPDKDSSEYKPFFKEERRKIKQGVTINGVHIPAWVYWHINHWMIDIDKEDPITKYVERETCHPLLWDNVWEIGEHINQAEKAKMGLLLLGTRQMSKSETGASYNGWRGVAFRNSQNIIAGLSDNDLMILLSKLKRGYINVTDFFKPETIKSNDKEIILGYKNPSGEDQKWSEILVRNLAEGKKTENLAGPTASSLFIDEIGKGDFLEAFIAAEPSLRSPFGWRCMPLFVGTSGSFEKSHDLQRFRQNLSTYNFMQVTMKDFKDQTIHFFPGCQSSMAKRKKVRLSTYKKVAKGSELDIIPIYVVGDKAEETRLIKSEIAGLEAANEFVLAKKKKMYYPETEEDLFLTDDSDNIFADIKQLAKDQLLYLNSIEYPEEYGWMERDKATGKAVFKKSNTDKPIMDFPIGEHEEKDAPIIIWDHPVDAEEYGILHVAGSDPYNQDESFYSTSLGTLYIYRRMYDPLKGRYQNSFVASYSARPKDMNKWYGQVRLLLEYYKATCLPENESRDFIQYFDRRNIIHYLEDGLDLAREINPQTKSNRKKGLSAALPNIKYGNGLLKQYCLEELDMGIDGTGDPIIKPGIIRIKDRALLREIIEFNPTDKIRKNVDRIVGARHALIIAASKDKYFPIAKIKPQEVKEKPAKRVIHSPFAHSVGAFGKRKSRPF